MMEPNELPLGFGMALAQHPEAMERFAGLPEAVMDGYEEYMGITVNMNDKLISTGTQLLFMIGCGCVALIFTILVSKKKHLNR